MKPVRIFVVDVEEFQPVLDAARGMPNATVSGPRAGYWLIESAQELVFQRKAMGFRPALWWSMLTGGYDGHIRHYTREELRMVRSDAP
jgi:hypothetical protein